MRIGSKSFLGLSVLAVGVALTLAGCIPVAPTPTPTDAASPSATPSPTPTAAALPVPTLPVTCADVFTDTAASDILGASVQLKVAETTIRDIYSIVSRQAGLLDCIWGGEGRTDNGWDEHIYLDVLPNAATEYDAGVWQVDDGATPYTAGDISEYLCTTFGDDEQYFCNANILIDGYWAQVNAQASAAGSTQQAAEARMAKLLDSLAVTIGGAGSANPAWAPPSDGITGAFCADITESTSTVQAAFGVPDLASDPYIPPPPYGASQVAQQRAGEQDCRWSAGFTSVYVQVVPGGAWAFPAIAAAPPRTSYALPVMAPVAIAGTDAAFVACGDGCYALLSVGGATVGVGTDTTSDPAAFAAALPPVAAAILAAG